MNSTVELATEDVDPIQDVSDRLTALVESQLEDARDVNVVGLRRTSGGFSRENWIFDATWVDADGDHELPLILRRDPESSPLDTDRFTEFTLLKALEPTNVPAPAAYWLDRTGGQMLRPSVVMERVSGRCDWMALNSDRPLDARLSLARQFTQILASIHAVDWKASGLGQVLGELDATPAQVEMSRWRTQLDRVQLEPLPELDLVERWLREHLPPAGDVVLVHGDYKPGNALIESDQITAILDWETAHLGDPLEDLGWMTNPVRRREQQINASWERDQIVQEYTARTGREVADSDLRWWNIFSCWRLSITNVTSVHDFVQGEADRIFQTPTWLFRRMFQLIEEEG